MKHIDKVMHFGMGTLISFLVFKGWESKHAAFVVACFVGLCKEIYDATKPEVHTASVWDFLATCAGGALVYLW